MDITVTDDKTYLILRNMTQVELEQTRLYFTKEPDDSWRYKNSEYAPPKTEFFNQYGLLPLGLWMELIEMCKEYGFSMNFDPKINNIIQDSQLQFDTFKYYSDKLFEGAKDDKGHDISLQDYQAEGVYKLIKFKRCCAEVTTSGGKTIMAYILFKFLRDVQHVKKFLYVVPSKSLVTQSRDKFELYENWVSGDHNWKSAPLYSNMKKADKEALKDFDILFATYQSLSHKDADFFSQFDCVFIDEAHHAKTRSIKTIIQRCINKNYCFGVTGTLPSADSYDMYTIESYIGPLVYQFSAFELINIKKFATPIYIVNQILDYASDNDKILLYESRKAKDKDDIQAGAKLMKAEVNYTMQNYTRMKHICDLAQKLNKNTLILFSDVNVNNYGRKIYDYLKDNSDKDVYYADGNTKSDAREYIKQRMEEDTTGNTVFVGSTGCFSEGIDVGNLWYIILANSVKSQYIVRQFIGRGMRRFPGKDKVVIFDIVDDLRYAHRFDKDSLKNNYMWKHHLERNKIYREQKFPVYEMKVDYKNQKLF